jgi:hypothetical protein
MQKQISRSIVPPHNLFGDHGQRCPKCSGLGRYLGLVPGIRVQNTTTCICKGTGVDQEFIQNQRWESMLGRLDALELAVAKERTRRSNLEAQIAKLQARSPKMSRQYWEECIAWATASGTAVANSTTETILMPNVTIPANYMQDGRKLRLTMMGGYGTTATPTLIMTVRWGGVSGTVLAKSSTVTLTSGVGGGASMTALWKWEMVIQTRSNGSSGTLMSNGDATLFTSTAGTAGTVTNYGMPIPVPSGSTGGTTPAAVTADLTADTALSITATFGTANAANSIQGHEYMIESLN